MWQALGSIIRYRLCQPVEISYKLLRPVLLSCLARQDWQCPKLPIPCLHPS